MPRGRKPVPLVLLDNKKAHYTKAEIRAREDAQVTGCSAELIPPKELSEEGREVWDRTVKLYNSLPSKLLCDLDVDMLSIYCELSAVLKQAQAEYKSMPLVGRDKRTGKMMRNEYLRLIHEVLQDAKSLSELLYLNPAGRARIEAAVQRGDEGDDPVAAYFRKYGE